MFGVKLVRTCRARHHDDGIAAPFARFLRNSVIELCSRNGPSRARARNGLLPGCAIEENQAARLAALDLLA